MHACMHVWLCVSMHACIAAGCHHLTALEDGACVIHVYMYSVHVYKCVYTRVCMHALAYLISCIALQTRNSAHTLRKDIKLYKNTKLHAHVLIICERAYAENAFQVWPILWHSVSCEACSCKCIRICLYIYTHAERMHYISYLIIVGHTYVHRYTHIHIQKKFGSARRNFTSVCCTRHACTHAYLPTQAQTYTHAFSTRS
jgi:hypothetical protein